MRGFFIVPQKIKSTRGQSAVEHIILLTLVMAGIIIAGPYVIRSWNANMKGWEDSTIDSLQDPLLTSIPESTPMEGCDNSIVPAWTNVKCGGGRDDVCTGTNFSCDAEYMLQERVYSPSICACSSSQPYFRCEQDSSYDCCSAWDYDDKSPLIQDPTSAQCGNNASPPCPSGEYRRNRTCDGGDPETECVPSPICSFHCIEPPAIGGAPFYGSLCPNDDTNLTKNVNFTLVKNGACDDPITGTKCQYQCSPGAEVAGSGIGAYCTSDVCGQCQGSNSACVSSYFNEASCLSAPEGCWWQAGIETCAGTYTSSVTGCGPPGTYVDCGSHPNVSPYYCDYLGCTWDPDAPSGSNCGVSWEKGNECIEIPEPGLCAVGGCTYDSYPETMECSIYDNLPASCTAQNGCSEGECVLPTTCRFNPPNIFIQGMYYYRSWCRAARKGYPPCPDIASAVWGKTTKNLGNCAWFKDERASFCGTKRTAGLEVCDGDPCIADILVPSSGGGQVVQFKMGMYNYETNSCISNYVMLPAEVTINSDGYAGYGAPADATLSRLAPSAPILDAGW